MGRVEEQHDDFNQPNKKISLVPEKYFHKTIYHSYILRSNQPHMTKTYSLICFLKMIQMMRLQLNSRVSFKHLLLSELQIKQETLFNYCQSD